MEYYSDLSTLREHVIVRDYGGGTISTSVIIFIVTPSDGLHCRNDIRSWTMYSVILSHAISIVRKPRAFSLP